MKESELAKLITDKFESDGYEVYKEVVNTGNGKNRADIIVVKDGEYTVIETKMSFGLTVIEQAFKWKLFSHYSYVALPRSTKRNARKFGYNMCLDYGIGVIDVGKKGDIKIVHESAYNDNPVLPQLYEEQKEQIAGAKPSKGSYITPFRITCNKLTQYIIDNGEMNITTAISNIEHHYKSDASAKNALTKLIKMGVLEQLIVYKEGRKTNIKLR